MATNTPPLNDIIANINKNPIPEFTPNRIASANLTPNLVLPRTAPQERPPDHDRERRN
ncbi:unnamed protein product, partial [Sphenostylis stenocarpa]